jgi:glycosyltransferase involved in cell wall biosynthesis|tara:strand:+ start:590 stop:1747 length:1158 start_codon:yes stop_codon:yes gene_type:complete
LKILILQSKSALGFTSGELRVAKNELHLLNSYGHQVELVEYGPGKLNNIFSKIYYVLNSVWSFKSYYEIKNILNETMPDIVHFHGLYPFLTLSSLIAAKKSQSKVILTLHNVSLVCLEGAFYRKGKFCNKCLTKSQLNGVFYGCYKNSIASFFRYISNKISYIFKIYDRSCDKIISVSDFIKEMHSSKFSNELITKYNYVIEKTKKNKVEPIDKTITFIGRLTYSKGVDTLIYLLNKLENVNINIIGNGPELNLITDLLQNRKNNNLIKIFSNLSNNLVQEIIQESSCVIIPSICAESFSLVAAEAMINKTPIVCYNVGGLGEIVKKSNSGIVVEVNDKLLFKKSISLILSDHLNSKKMGLNGYVFAKKNFSREKNYNILSEIYK